MPHMDAERQPARLGGGFVMSMQAAPGRQQRSLTNPGLGGLVTRPPSRNRMMMRRSDADAGGKPAGDAAAAAAAVPGVAFLSLRRRTLHAPGPGDERQPADTDARQPQLQAHPLTKRLPDASGGSSSSRAVPWDSSSSACSDSAAVSSMGVGTPAAPSTLGCSTPASAGQQPAKGPGWLNGVLRFASPRGQHAQAAHQCLYSCNEQHQDHQEQQQQQLLPVPMEELEQLQQELLEHELLMAMQQQQQQQQQQHEEGADAEAHTWQQQQQQQGEELTYEQQLLLQYQEQLRLQQQQHEHNIQQLQQPLDAMAQLAEQAHWATQRQLLQLQLEEQQLEQQRHALTTGGGGGTTRSTSINAPGVAEAGAAAAAAGHFEGTAGLACASSPAPGVHSLPGGQGLTVTPEELQEIMSVVQALADAKHTLAAKLSSSGGGGHSSGGSSSYRSESLLDELHLELQHQQAQPLGPGQIDLAALQAAFPELCGGSDGGALSGTSGGGVAFHSVHCITAERSSSLAGHAAGAGHCCNCDNSVELQLPQHQLHSERAGQRQAAEAVTSSGGGSVLAKLAVKPQLFDFESASLEHAETHYLRGSQDEAYRIKARAASAGGFHAASHGSGNASGSSGFWRACSTLPGCRLDFDSPRDHYGSAAGAGLGGPGSSKGDGGVCNHSGFRPHTALASVRFRTHSSSAAPSSAGAAASAATSGGGSSQHSSASTAGAAGNACPSTASTSGGGSSRLGGAGGGSTRRATSAERPSRPWNYALPDGARVGSRIGSPKRLRSQQQQDDSCSGGGYSSWLALRSGEGRTGWTDDDSPRKQPRQEVTTRKLTTSGGGGGAADVAAPGGSTATAAVPEGASNSAKDERVIQQLSRKVIELEAGLSSLLAGQAIPAAAAAAIIAAVSSMKVSKGSSAGGATLDKQQQQADAELQAVIAAINGPGPEAAAVAADGNRQAASVMQQQQQPGAVSSSTATSGTATAVFTAAASQEQDASPLGARASSVSIGVQACPPQPEAAAAPAAAAEQPTTAASAAATAPAAPAAQEAVSPVADLQVATGAFSQQRFDAFNQHVDAAMARRAAAHCFDSDLEEDEVVDEAAAAAAADKADGAASDGDGNEVTAAMRVLAKAEQKLQRLQEQEAQMQAMWACQDEWMDAYRDPTAASSKRQAGHAGAAERSQAEGADAADAAAAGGGGVTAGAASLGGLRVVDASSSEALPLFPNFEAVVEAIAGEANSSTCGPAGPLPAVQQQQQQRSKELAAAAAAATAAAEWPEVCYSSDNGLDALKQQQQQQQIYPDSQAEASDAYPVCSGSVQRPPSIASVKLQQDLQIHAQAEAAEHTFAARPVPASTREMRYHQLLAQQHSRRAATHEKYLHLLASSSQPFSFQARHAEAEAAKEAARSAAADDSNSAVQVPFKAKRVPQHVHEARYEAMMAAHEASRLAAKVKAEMARERVAKEVEEEQGRRHAESAAKYQEALAAAATRGSGRHSAASGRHSVASGSSSTRSSGDGSGTSRPGSKRQQQRKQSPVERELLQSAGSGNSSGSPRPFVLRHTSYSIDSSGGGSSSASSAAASTAGAADAHEGSGAAAAPLASLGDAPSSTSGPEGQRSRLARSVPDFKALHAKWEAAQASKKEACGRRPTVPQAPRFMVAAEEQAKAASRAAQQQLQLQQQQQQQRLAKASGSPRGAAAGGSPRSPAGGPPGSSPRSRPLHRGTAATSLRAEATRQAMLEGRFDSREEREHKEWQAGRLEMQQQHKKEARSQWEAQRLREEQQHVVEEQWQHKLESEVSLQADTLAAAAMQDMMQLTQHAGLKTAAELAGIAVAASGEQPSSAGVASHLHQLLSGAGAAAAPEAAGLEEQQPQQVELPTAALPPRPPVPAAAAGPEAPTSHKLIPPMAAPTKAAAAKLQRAASPSAAASVRPLQPSLLPSPQASMAGGAAFGARAASSSRAELGARHADACAAAEAALRMAAAALADAAPSLSTSAAAATAAVRAVAKAAAALDSRSMPRISAVATDGCVEHQASSSGDGVVAGLPRQVAAAAADPCAQQQQQQPEQAAASRQPQQEQPAAAASSQRAGQQLLPRQPELVAMPAAQLSVRDRIQAINAAFTAVSRATAGSGSLSAPASANGSGSHSKASWGRSFGVATGAAFGCDAASRAHVCLIEQLNQSQVGTLVERRRAPLAGRQDAPLIHIEARHAQAAKAARGMVDEALQQAGVTRGYKALEGEGRGAGGGQ